MKKIATICGRNFRLRPVSKEDSSFIVRLRNSPANNQYIHQGAATLEEQDSWTKKYLEKENDFYYVVEESRLGVPRGLISLYNFSKDGVSAEWGRWIIDSSPAAAYESVHLLLNHGFKSLQLREIYSTTVAENLTVIRFHRSLKEAKETYKENYFEFSGGKYDAIEHRLFRDKWDLVSPFLVKMAMLSYSMGQA